MAKEFKILFAAILTQILYGVSLLFDGAPFLISPLNVLVNLCMTITIIVSLKKFDWRNFLMLSGAIIILFHDALFWSFFSVSMNTLEQMTILYTTTISAKTLSFIAMFDKRKIQWNILVLVTLILSILSFWAFGIYGSFAVTVAGLILVLLSKNEEIEFLKVYWMFFTFMLLNHVATMIYYSV